MNQYLLDRELDALWSADDLDAMIDLAAPRSRRRPGGGGDGALQGLRNLSNLFDQLRGTLENARRYLGPPINFPAFDREFTWASGLLQQVRRRETERLAVVLRLFDNGARAVRQAMRHGSLPAAPPVSRSPAEQRIDPRTSLERAISNFLLARDAGGFPGNSPLYTLLRTLSQTLQNAHRYLRNYPPIIPRGFYEALTPVLHMLPRLRQQAERFLNARQETVLAQLNNAAGRMQQARAQAMRTGLFGGNDPRMSLGHAITHIQNARNALGLR